MILSGQHDFCCSLDRTSRLYVSCPNFMKEPLLERIHKVEYKLLENQLTAKDFIRLKVETGFRDRPIDQVEKALENDLFDVVALVDGEVIGIV